ncbi:MAG: alpha/beta hydrolase [Eubacteriales bacterium]|nr:alpha/beta hydrolase [Eubacteriales bacterium]
MSQIRFRSLTLPKGDVFSKSKTVAADPMPLLPPMSDTVDTTGLQRFWLDIPYASISETQTLALFLPNTGVGPFPLVINIHGGGFAFGNKYMGLDDILKPGLAKGFAIASINYRLSGEAKFPAAIEDTKAAIRFLRANASKYSLDPQRFATWGQSAGGNLSALAAITGRMTVFTNPLLGNANVSSQLSAAVDFCGPIDFLTMDDQYTINGLDGQNHNSADSFESQYLGAPIQTVPWLAKESNPQTYLTIDGCPPFLIEHGTKDENIPYQQSVILSEYLLTALPPTEINLRLLDGATHCSAQFMTEENIEFTYAFLAKYLQA